MSSIVLRRKCHASIFLAATALCECAQLIDAATNGKAADVDRLIKDGAYKEAKDRVRSSFRCEGRSQ